MIVLEKDNRKMGVCTDVQASAFVSCGWRRVDASSTSTSVSQKQDDGEKKYTKTEIARMKADDLRALATEVGLSITEESTGADLKDALIEHFGL